MNIICRLGRHWPSPRWQLDLTDQQVKSHCRACGAVIVRSPGGIEVQGGRVALRARTRSRPHAALAGYGVLTIVAAAGSLALWAHESPAPAPASVTVKLPPARPAVPSPGFDFTR